MAITITVPEEFINELEPKVIKILTAYGIWTDKYTDTLKKELLVYLLTSSYDFDIENFISNTLEINWNWLRSMRYEECLVDLPRTAKLIVNPIENDKQREKYIKAVYDKFDSSGVVNNKEEKDLLLSRLENTEQNSVITNLTCAEITKKITTHELLTMLDISPHQIAFEMLQIYKSNTVQSYRYSWGFNDFNHVYCLKFPDNTYNFLEIQKDYKGKRGYRKLRIGDKQSDFFEKNTIVYFPENTEWLVL